MIKIEKSNFELDEEKAKHSTLSLAREKIRRRLAIKNARFFLYKRTVGSDDLSPIGSFETEADIRKAYEKALDEDVFQENLVGFKGRLLEFGVKETKRRITVR